MATPQANATGRATHTQHQRRDKDGAPRGRENGPLADRRGARGRAVAIRAAILTARRAGTSVEDALQQAIDAGIPPRRERLF